MGRQNKAEQPPRVDAIPPYLADALAASESALEHRDAVARLRTETATRIVEVEHEIDQAGATLASDQIDELLSGQSASGETRARLLALRDELAALEARRHGVISRSEQADAAVVSAHEVLSKARLKFRGEKIAELRPLYEAALGELFRVAKRCQAEVSGFGPDGRLDGIDLLVFPDLDNQHKDLFRLQRIRHEGGATIPVPAWSIDPELSRSAEQLGTLRRLFRRSESENKAILERRSRQQAHALAWPDAAVAERKSA